MDDNTNPNVPGSTPGVGDVNQGQQSPVQPPVEPQVPSEPTVPPQPVTDVPGSTTPEPTPTVGA